MLFVDFSQVGNGVPQPRYIQVAIDDMLIGVEVPVDKEYLLMHQQVKTGCTEIVAPNPRARNFIQRPFSINIDR